MLLLRYYLPVVEKGAKIGVFCLRGDRRQQIPKRTLAGREYDEAVWAGSYGVHVWREGVLSRKKGLVDNC